MQEAVEEFLPHPADRNGVAKLVKPMVSMPIEDMWRGKKIKPGFIIGYLKKHKVVKPQDKYFEIVNQHLFLRSCNQVNESCNKIRGSCELYHHALRHPENLLCSAFSPGFLSSSTIPQLYYAGVSSLLSILGFFGVGSYRSSEEWPIDYNLVRTERGFSLIRRAKHIKHLTGHTGGGWHPNLPLLYEGLVKNGVELPSVDIESFKELQSARMEFDYTILTKPTMEGFYGVRLFFDLLLPVIRMTDDAIQHMRQLRAPMHNGCDRRFNDLWILALHLRKDVMEDPRWQT